MLNYASVLVGLGLRVAVICAGLFLKSDPNSAGVKKGIYLFGWEGDTMYSFDGFSE